jgi:hypothetical protein
MPEHSNTNAAAIAATPAMSTIGHRLRFRLGVKVSPSTVTSPILPTSLDTMRLKTEIQEHIEIIGSYANSIAKKWIDYFVLHRQVRPEVITRRIK